MIFKQLLITKQKFKAVDDRGIHVFLANVEALSCVEQVTKILLDHKSQEVYVYNYDPSMYSCMGSERNSLSAEMVEKLNTMDELPLIFKYFEAINKYFIEKTNELDRTYFFSISFTFNKVGTEKASLCVKVLPYLYTIDRKLCATLCIFEKSNHTGKPKLRLHNVKDQQTLLYVTSSGRFVNEERIVLNANEIEILRRSGEGEKEQQIADALLIPIASLKRMKTTIFEKLKVSSISEAIFVAYKQGYF